MKDLVPAWQEKIRDAGAHGHKLGIAGSGSKYFYARPDAAEQINTTEYSGVILYEPTELVVRARAGTRLAEVEALLAENGQCLPFEPPHFGAQATLGGMVASGLSGPRRFVAGAVRDYMLGISIIDGRGELLNFGGEVIKNVAGYDVSRLMTGSFGALGLITEVALKVMPQNPASLTLMFAMDEQTALEKMHHWLAQSLPISGTFYYRNQLYLRLGGGEQSVRAAQQQLGGELVGATQAEQFWLSVREQTHAAFAGPCWRYSLPSRFAALADLDVAIEWGGALRWTNSAPDVLQQQVFDGGGSVLPFRNINIVDATLPAASSNTVLLAGLAEKLKVAFDPQRVFSSHCVSLL